VTAPQRARPMNELLYTVAGAATVRVTASPLAIPAGPYGTAAERHVLCPAVLLVALPYRFTTTVPDGRRPL
jgi:hypothetical protein